MHFFGFVLFGRKGNIHICHAFVFSYHSMVKKWALLFDKILSKQKNIFLISLFLFDKIKRHEYTCLWIL